GAASDVSGLYADRHVLTGGGRKLFSDGGDFRPDGILCCMVPEYADPSAVDRRDHFPGADPSIAEHDGHPGSGCESDPGCVFRHLASEVGAGDLPGASGFPARISGSEIRDIDRTDVPALPL